MHIYICCIILHLLVHQICPKKFHQICLEAVQLQISIFTFWKILFSAICWRPKTQTGSIHSFIFIAKVHQFFMRDLLLKTLTGKSNKPPESCSLFVSVFSHFKIKIFDQSNSILVVKPFQHYTLRYHHCTLSLVLPSFCH